MIVQIVFMLSICSTCGEEYTGETGMSKPKLRDHIQGCPQHIRQPEYQKFKVKEKHLRTCVKGTFKTFQI